jgi:hypothetical protein
VKPRLILRAAQLVPAFLVALVFWLALAAFLWSL